MKEKITAIKGFSSDWKCRDIQFEIGKTYHHAGEVKACKSGYHSCEYGLDVFAYYAPCDSKYAEVVISGDRSHHDDDTKIASASITIKAELSLPQLVSRSVEWILGTIETAKVGSNTGYQSAATNTGDRSAAINTGGQSAATVSGGHSVAIACGYQSKAKAAAGGAIVICHRDDAGDLLHIRASKVGENGIEPNIFYTLSKTGEFMEAQHD